MKKPSDVDVYLAARAERDAVLEDAQSLAERAERMLEVLGRDPLLWTFQRVNMPPSNEPNPRRAVYRAEEADPNRNLIDAALWPTIEAMQDIQGRLRAATRKTDDAFAELSVSEKELVSAAASASRQSGRARSKPI